MNRTFFLFIVIIVLSIQGCVTSASSRHNQRLEELDNMYKAGKIDSSQYLAKYNSEVEDYNTKNTAAFYMLEH